MITLNDIVKCHSWTQLALPIHDDVRFGAWAALGDFGRTGSFGYFTV